MRPRPFTYGVTVSPSNSTGRNGSPGTASGSTGCIGAVTFTGSGRSRASGSRSVTSTVHSRNPVSLSRACTGAPGLEASKLRSGSTFAANTPNGNVSPKLTLNGPRSLKTRPPARHSASTPRACPADHARTFAPFPCRPALPALRR